MTMPIPGYTHGTASLPPSPVNASDLERMKETVAFTDEDARYLRMSADVLDDQIEAVLDVWYGFVGANPHLLASFAHPRSGEPDTAYLSAVRKRFGQWIRDTAAARYDEAWLAYQHEIGRRHHRVAKNTTDGADAAAIVPFRYLFLLAVPITTTLRPFLESKGHDAPDVDSMAAAWLKSVLLQLTLWSYPYVREGDF